MAAKDWGAGDLNKVGHSFGVKFGDSGNPFLRKALKDKVRHGNCFAYSMLWCKQCIKNGRKLNGVGELTSSFGLKIAAQAMQNWIVRQNAKGTFGPTGMYGEDYYKAMAAAFGVDAELVGKDTQLILTDHNGWLDLVTGSAGHYVIAFSMAAGGAHAVAARNHGQDLIFFDPNFGQFSGSQVHPADTIQFQIDIKKGLDATYDLITKWIAVKVK